MTHPSDAVLPANAPEFRLTRVFDAPRALVYKCWMNPGYLARWWGPKTMVCPVCEIDARDRKGQGKRKIAMLTTVTF